MKQIHILITSFSILHFIPRIDALFFFFWNTPGLNPNRQDDTRSTPDPVITFLFGIGPHGAVSLALSNHIQQCVKVIPNCFMIGSLGAVTRRCVSSSPQPVASALDTPYCITWTKESAGWQTQDMTWHDMTWHDMAGHGILNCICTLYFVCSAL